jgi:DMSO/TMAO reductase YedYZ molybdopterin-dependent catalytic subunit
VVRAAWLGATALVLGWVQPVRFLFPSRRPAAKLAVEPIVIVEPPPSSPGFDAIEGLAPRVTALEDFYVVDEAIVDPDVDPAVWRLRVFGHVDTPFELTYDELLGLPAVEQYATLECISNVVGGDLISTARWTGIAMPYLLGRAGASAGAVEVVFTAVGGYSDSIPITVATRDDVLVAIGMNGRELPREHGFPARLLAPGYFGMKQPKWLESIEVVDQPYVGYWERRGWIKAAVVKTMSRIDTVAEIGGGSVVAGVAFSGIRGISRVEVSLDGGAKWEEAELEATLSAQTWRRWRSRAFDPAGVEEIRVRATDGRGETQTSRVEDPHPSGATGWHMVGV